MLLFIKEIKFKSVLFVVGALMPIVGVVAETQIFSYSYEAYVVNRTKVKISIKKSCFYDQCFEGELKPKESFWLTKKEFSSIENMKVYVELLGGEKMSCQIESPVSHCAYEIFVKESKLICPVSSSDCIHF